MKIAVTYENGQVFQHFGHTRSFKLYTIEDGKLASSQIVPVTGGGHSALAGMLADLGVDTLICGGIGMGAQMALDQADISLYAGVTGEADIAVARLLAGTLPQNAAANCSHHDHEHGHDCSCGHDHDHHEHGHDCSCGHDHHEHGHDCSCGHDH